MQSVHGSVLDVNCLPFTQNLHWYSMDIASSWYFPMAHSLHVVAASNIACPGPHSVHSVEVVVNAVPCLQTSQDGLAWVFCGWYFPSVHGVQVKVSVMVPALQLR